MNCSLIRTSLSSEKLVLGLLGIETYCIAHSKVSLLTANLIPVEKKTVEGDHADFKFCLSATVWHNQ